jgi:hypothetical protein
MAVRPHPKKIVLNSTDGYCDAVDASVAEFVQDGVIFIGVVGKECERIEGIIDELCVGDASNPHDILTSSHPGQMVEQALAFANSLAGEFAGAAEVIDLSPASHKG